MSRRLHAVRGTAALLLAGALAGTFWHGLRQPAVAASFGLVIAVGALVRSELPGLGARLGPVGAAGVLGYALLGAVQGAPARQDVLQVVAVAAAAGTAGLAPHIARGRAPGLDEVARGVLTTAFAAACARPLHTTGLLHDRTGQGGGQVLGMVVVLLLTGLCEAVLAAVTEAARTGWPLGPLLRDRLRAAAAVAPAIGATGAVLALAVAVAGLWALPVVCVPLLLTQLSFRRYAAVRATRRETVASLARATEVAGYTPHGHARRVAALGRAMGRELGMAERELTVLEHAALMHDIGQLSLVDPVPGGATEPLPEEERRRIALLGAAVVRRTGAPAEVADVVAHQADPYREQSQAARVVRVANAYEDLAEGPDGPAARLAALERLRLEGSGAYDPRVVQALTRVVAGRGW
jgi:HD domain-containing protein